MQRLNEMLAKTGQYSEFIAGRLRAQQQEMRMQEEEESKKKDAAGNGNKTKKQAGGENKKRKKMQEDDEDVVKAEEKKKGIVDVFCSHPPKDIQLTPNRRATIYQIRTATLSCHRWQASKLSNARCRMDCKSIRERTERDPC